MTLAPEPVRDYETIGNMIGHTTTAKDYYQFVPANWIDGCQVAFLTVNADPFGHSNSFAYTETASDALLNTVLDADGRTTSPAYSNAGSALITSVTDPIGATARFLYDNRRCRREFQAGMPAPRGWSP